MSRRGSQERATAIIARWRSPPLNSNEYSSMRRSGFGMPDAAQRLDSPASRLLPADRAVEEDRLDELRADRMNGTEGGHGLLKDETDVSPSNRPHLAAVGLELDEVGLRSVGAGQNDLAVDDPTGTIDDPQDRLRRDALSAAALADDAERLARERRRRKRRRRLWSFPRPGRSWSVDSCTESSGFASFCMIVARVVEVSSGSQAGTGSGGCPPESSRLQIGIRRIPHRRRP